MSSTAVYAKDQPQGFSNTLRNVAIVGATGQMGAFIIEEVQRRLPKLQLTALTRAGSNTSSLPSGVRCAEVNYDQHSTLVEALRGQDLLLITLAVTAPPDTHDRLVDAAAEAGVRWIIPNGWGIDPSTEAAQREGIVSEPNAAKFRYIEKKGLTWTSISCGFWYEYSLSGGTMMYGIDAQAKHAVLYGGGNVALSTSTWEQTARAVAALLALPLFPQDASDKSTVTLSRWANKHVHVNSFTLSQRQMLDAVQKITNTTDADWTIETPSAKSVYDAGVQKMMQGDRSGFAAALYSRMFFPDEPANFDKAYGLDNGVLGLPSDDLLACTQKAIEMQKEQYIAKRFATMQQEEQQQKKAE